MIKTEALKLALEALETERDIYREHDEDGSPEYILEAITAIKEALAQQSNAQVEPISKDQWWAKELEGFWGDSDYVVTLDTRRAALTALSVIFNKPPSVWSWYWKELLEENESLRKQTQQQCYCGDITRLGVIHRADSFCDTHPPVPTAQPEQEPVANFGSAYVNENGVHITTVLGPVAIPQDAKLYTTPPQRKPLTDEQIIKIVKDNTVQGYHGDYFDAWGIIDDVEAAHGIKE